MLDGNAQTTYNQHIVAQQRVSSTSGIKIGPYEARFYEYDLAERPHAHIRREGKQAKFWLTPIELFQNKGYADHELGRIERMLSKNQKRLLALWEEEMKKR